jgi:DNA-binding cell septation regulator SpoVG
MPSKKRKDGTFRDIAHPLNSDTRRRMEGQILDRYRSEVSDGQEIESRVLSEGSLNPDAPPPPGPSGEI